MNASYSTAKSIVRPALVVNWNFHIGISTFDVKQVCVSKGDKPAPAHEVRTANRLKFGGAIAVYVIVFFENGNSVGALPLLLRRLYCRHWDWQTQIAIHHEIARPIAYTTVG
jgi:hypothetical protein